VKMRPDEKGPWPSKGSLLILKEVSSGHALQALQGGGCCRDPRLNIASFILSILKQDSATRVRIGRRVPSRQNERGNAEPVPHSPADSPEVPSNYLVETRAR